MIMEHLAEAVKLIMKRFGPPIRVFESGTIRSHDEHHESTRIIGELLGDKGTLDSVDTDFKAIRISKSICEKLDNIQWHRKKGSTFLRSKEEKPFYHLAFLDSANNADVIFEEFELAIPRMWRSGIIFVDDAASPTDPNVKKGAKIIPWLVRRRIPYLLKKRAGNIQQLQVNVWEILDRM